MKIYNLIDKGLLEEMIAKKYISVQEHDTYGYKIYNYTQSCQFSHIWNDATELCRGLITDENGEIIARPFRKFYNYEEIADKSVIPTDLPYEVYEKKDGSLGILYWSPGGFPLIATRGSFNSEQAKWATKYLHRLLGIKDRKSELCEILFNFTHRLNNVSVKKLTILFEIVYPEDRHIVDYGREESLTVLAIIDNDTGEEYNPELLSNIFTVAKTYGQKEWRTIRDLSDGSNAEGFVVKFSNNFRMKLKFEEWFKKNALLQGLSKKTILNYIANNDLKTLFVTLNQLNEENRIYYKNLIKEFRKQYAEIEIESFSEYKEFETDKEAALYFNNCKYRPILFAIRKGQDYSNIIWKRIKDSIKEIQKCE